MAARWVQQERGELDYDAKNMMHLTRLLFSGENIVKNGEPIGRFEGEKLETLLPIESTKYKEVSRDCACRRVCAIIRILWHRKRTNIASSAFSR